MTGTRWAGPLTGDIAGDAWFKRRKANNDEFRLVMVACGLVRLLLTISVQR